MIELNMRLTVEDVELLRDTLLSATDCGDDEFPYKSDELDDMVRAVCKYIEMATA